MKQITFIILLALAGCTTVPVAQPSRIHHVVLCWLKEPGNTEQRRQIVEVSRSFRNIPGVLDVRAGEKIDSDSKVADNTFDVAITLSFKNTEDLQAYVAHPIHQKAKDEILLPATKKIIVYDFKE